MDSLITHQSLILRVVISTIQLLNLYVVLVHLHFQLQLHWSFRCTIICREANKIRTLISTLAYEKLRAFNYAYEKV